MKKQNIKKVALLIIPIIILLIGFIFPKEQWAYLVNLSLILIELFTLILNYKEENNYLKIILSVIICFMLLTWILPTASFNGEYVEQGRSQMGLFDLLNYPVTAISYFCFIAFYIFSIGAFYGVLNKIPAYRSFLDKFVNSIKGTEKFVLFIFVLLISVLTSIGGMQLALLCLFPLLISLITLMGFDKIVAALTLVGSTVVGIIGNTYGEGNFGILNKILGISSSDEMLTKVVLLLLGIIILFVNIMFYIKKHNSLTNDKKINLKEKEESNNNVVVEETKIVDDGIKNNKKTSKDKSTNKTTSKKETTKKVVKKSTVKKDTIKKTTKKTTSQKGNKKNSNKPSLFDEDYILVPNDVKNKHSIWPIVTTFIILFIIIILAFIPWMKSFGVKFFDDLLKNTVEFKLFDFALFGKLFGTVNAFGAWSPVELTVVLLLLTIVLAIIYKISFKEILNNAITGIKKALPFATLAVLLYTILVICTFHPFQLVIYKAILGVVDKFNFVSILAISLSNVLAGFFNIESLYAMQSFVPYLSTIVAEGNYVNIALISQAMYGLSMLFVPTSLILVLTLSYLDISYKKWLKTIWKLILELLLAIMIVLSIVVLL